MKQGVMHYHTNTLKPYLTEVNKYARLQMALSFVNPNDKTKYQSMMDLIHVDEKWFYITKKDEHYILVVGDGEEDEEEEPLRQVQNKGHII